MTTIKRSIEFSFVHLFVGNVFFFCLQHEKWSVDASVYRISNSGWANYFTWFKSNTINVVVITRSYIYVIENWHMLINVTVTLYTVQSDGWCERQWDTQYLWFMILGESDFEAEINLYVREFWHYILIKIKFIQDFHPPYMVHYVCVRGEMSSTQEE